MRLGERPDLDALWREYVDPGFGDDNHQWVNDLVRVLIEYARELEERLAVGGAGGRDGES